MHLAFSRSNNTSYLRTLQVPQGHQIACNYYMDKDLILKGSLISFDSPISFAVGAIGERLDASSNEAGGPELPKPHYMPASRVRLVNNPVTSRKVLHLENDHSSFVASADGYFMHRNVG